MGSHLPSVTAIRGDRVLSGEHSDGGGAPPDLADQELLAGCRAGDATSWDTLVRRYESLIFTMAREAGLGDHDAAEVTQATFVALLDAGATIRDDERLASWLMTVAHRQVWRARRRVEREPASAPLEPQGNTIEEWERLTVLYDGLMQLGSPCQDLLVGLYLDPRRPTYSALARRLGVAVGTIGPKRGRCLAMLRTLLGEDER